MLLRRRGMCGKSVRRNYDAGASADGVCLYGRQQFIWVRLLGSGESLVLVIKQGGQALL
jgi:hypothetical protein